MSADATADGEITLTLLSGPAIDVRDLDVRVTVEGVELRHQPPVPFFASRGFQSGPTGPFNLAADPEWAVGETASFGVATTNHPSLDPGDGVRIRLFVDGQIVAVAETEV